MDINFTIDENQLSQSENEKLKVILKCQDDEALTMALNKIGKAAIFEYLEMMLGKQLPNRGDEYRERRMLQLLKYFFDGRFPSESEVGLMFQLTDTSSKNLLRKVRTKYRFELENMINETIKSSLEDAEQIEDDDFEMTLTSSNLLEEMKRAIYATDVTKKPITKQRDTVGVYKIPKDTYELLKKYYGIEDASESA